MCYLNRVIDESMLDGRYQGTVPQVGNDAEAEYLTTVLARSGSISPVQPPYARHGSLTARCLTASCDAGSQFRTPDTGSAFADLSNALAIEPNYAAVGVEHHHEPADF